VPFSKKIITQKDIYASLGEITAGKRKGRTSDEEITLFDSTGLAIQDVSCAYTVYKALKDKPGIKKIELF
jgi:alanine dehydrogenase